MSGEALVTIVFVLGCLLFCGSVALFGVRMNLRHERAAAAALQKGFNRWEINHGEGCQSPGASEKLLAAGAGEGKALPLPPSLQEHLSPSIEARLTQEMARLVRVLDEIGRRLQSIGEDVPAGRQFVKLIPSALGTFCLEFSNALAVARDDHILLDDGRHYLAQLGLNLEQLVRYFDHGGLRYMGIACGKGTGDQVLDGSDAGAGGTQRGDDVHGSPTLERSSVGPVPERWPPGWTAHDEVAFLLARAER